MEVRTDGLFDNINGQITLEKDNQDSIVKPNCCCDEELDSNIDYEMNEFANMPKLKVGEKITTIIII